MILSLGSTLSTELSPYLNNFWEKYLKQQEILTFEVFLIKNVGKQYTFSRHLSLGLLLFYFTFELVIILDPGS